MGKYIMMALVTVSTIYHSVFQALMILISEGWTIIRGHLSRSQATYITLLMGSVYLAYSAYYISSSSSNVRNTISMIINMLYVLLFVIVIRNSLSVL